jgi:predicted Fe-Mo cluster-binding NifX family protein
MNVAISTQAGDIDALVDPRFGRSRWFLIADTKSGEWTVVDNASNADASGGAGIHAAKVVIDHGVSAIITGNVGPNAQRALSAGGVAVFQAGNGVSARQAIDALKRGELAQATGPTVTGHWA